MRDKIIKPALASAVIVAALTVSACGRTADRWCEEDATDLVADNSLCVTGVPGYEWEPDTHHSKKRPTSTAAPRPAVLPRATGGWPPPSTPRTATPPSKPVPSKTLTPKSPPTSRR